MNAHHRSIYLRRSPPTTILLLSNIDFVLKLNINPNNTHARSGLNEA